MLWIEECSFCKILFPASRSLFDEESWSLKPAGLCFSRSLVGPLNALAYPLSLSYRLLPASPLTRPAVNIGAPGV